MSDAELRSALAAEVDERRKKAEEKAAAERAARKAKHEAQRDRIAQLKSEAEAEEGRRKQFIGEGRNPNEVDEAVRREGALFWRNFARGTVVVILMVVLARTGTILIPMWFPNPSRDASAALVFVWIISWIMAFVAFLVACIALILYTASLCCGYECALFSYNVRRQKRDDEIETWMRYELHPY